MKKSRLSLPVPHANERNMALDVLRVWAIFLVIWQHANEYYYIGPGLSLIKENAPAVAVIDSYARSCIGLFVMISGWLLLPLQTDTRTFFRKRFTRLVFPWLFWCVAYAVYYVFQRGDTLTEMFSHIAHIPLNFGTEVGHLWFVYMMAGLYLLMPVISPWLRSCSKRELQFYLLLWVVTSTLPYLHLAWPSLWGECTWNPTPMLYYFTGFGGYLVLGHYLRRYGSFPRGASWAMLVVGYAVQVAIFAFQTPFVDGAVRAEEPWGFCCTGVVMMVAGTFSLISRLRIKGSGLFARWTVSISVCSYGMYLCHIMILNAMHDIVDPMLSTSFVLKVVLIAVPTFVISWLMVRLLAPLPRSKWWLGV